MVGSGSNEEKGRKALDSTVGGLVWVQRRNGSWWPGQIVGLDELPENCLSSPRSGTPIKLLGRDDLNVEWHDLETTKIIKAFRCGEYDACIEKAKVSAPKFLKRSLKYPRKEIAIIRALEIENSLIKNVSNLGNDHECSSEETSSELTRSPGEVHLNSTQKLSRSGISREETNGSICLKGNRYKSKRGSPNDSEDDGNEGFKRMKGLNDLGVGSDQNIQVLALPNNVGPQSSLSVSTTRAANANGMAVGSLANGGSLPTFKKKRSQVVHLHELLKKKRRRRPLIKVLENASMVPVRIICDESANPFERSDSVSPYECEDDKKVNDAEPLHKYLPEVYFSDTQFDVPFINEELDPSGVSPVLQPSSLWKPHVGVFKGNSGNNFRAQDSYVKHEAFNEHVPVYCSTSVNQKVEKGASIWQSKGKRKARYLSKNGDITISPSSSSNELINGLRKHICSQRSVSYHQPRFYSSELSDVPSLYEVEVTVETTRPQAQHVPYISLVSKVSGKPITGHPLTVEALEDGFCDYPVNGSCDLVDQDAKINYSIEPNKCKSKRKKIRLHYHKWKSFKSRRHGCSSKKTRKLSSIGGPDTYKLLTLEKRKPMVQSSKDPTQACVPLKIVFSRINQALSRSTQSAHCVVTSNNT
ncbi:hypothetical protein RDABS01_007563 [Bienertia sinuspersici]